MSEDVRNSLSKAWHIDSFLKATKDKNLQEVYNKSNKNPILIVSNPCSIDGFLITFNKNLPKEINEKNCKNSFSGIVGSKFNEETELKFYKTNLTKEILENQKNNFALQLILSIFKK